MAAGNQPLTLARVEPRDAHAAALSYDGREPPATLHSLTTMPVPASSPHTFAPLTLLRDTVPAHRRDATSEMVQPNDCARRIVGEIDRGGRADPTAHVDPLRALRA